MQLGVLLMSSPTMSAKLLQSVPLFVTPWTVARQAPLSMGLSTQEYQNGLPCPPPGDLPDPGMEHAFFFFLMSPAFAGRLFTTSATWETSLPELNRPLLLCLLSVSVFYLFILQQKEQ